VYILSEILQRVSVAKFMTGPLRLSDILFARNDDETVSVFGVHRPDTSPTTPISEEVSRNI